jgi:hypothetical protein
MCGNGPAARRELSAAARSFPEGFYSTFTLGYGQTLIGAGKLRQENHRCFPEDGNESPGQRIKKETRF